MQTAIFKPASHLTFDTVCIDNRHLLKYLQNQKSASIQIDLSDVKQCDTAGLAFLIEARRMCIQYKKSLEIIGLSSDMIALAEFCGVGSMLLGELNG